MEFRTNTKPYLDNPGEVLDIVKRFSDGITGELGPLVKSVVSFGSAVRGGFDPGKKSLREEVLFGSDIDVLILFDDMIDVINPEIITAYRVVTENVASKISKRLHITTMALTKFWDYASKGDPILINMLRDGTAVMDAGCFGMAKKMLSTGLIAPTKDIVWIYMGKGPLSIANANWNMRESVLDLYWSVFDAAHAALLHYNVVPDVPDDVISLMKIHLVNKGILDKQYLPVVAEFMNVGKLLMSAELHKMSGDHFDRYRKEAIQFLRAVREVIETK